MDRIFKAGDIVRHFKYETVSEEEKGKLAYMYQIVGIAIHSETGEKMVVYKALYGNKEMYVRPYDMFCGEVDRGKYPDVAQKYRFEKV